MRIFIIPRMGCLGWLFLGWILFGFYFAVGAAALALILVLCLIAAVALIVDVSLKAIPAYRRHRVLTPLHWPTDLAEWAIGLIGEQNRRPRGRPSTVMDRPAPADGTPPKPGWFNVPGSTEMRWWDGSSWSSKTFQPPR